ncbi:neprilysin-2 [Tribolium castaneum]|nr:PREDICTED: endothelin-converting enzyme 1 [Tribolium castaneum]|eukprot:XP_008194353.1 PREDICTED: endothelin-converting enzyme 1 [Tribolium castaneum]
MPEPTLKIQNPPWWRRRSRTEKTLLIVTAVLTMLIIILLAVNLIRLNEGCHDICLTPGCVKTAAQVLEKVDLNANPCEDFYNFACGNFIKNTAIPDDKAMISSFSIVEDEVEDLMQSILKKPIAPTDTKPIVLAKTLYQACMNTREIEANSVIKFKQLMKKLGGWPVIEGPDWDENEFEWLATSYKFMKTGMTPDMLLNIVVEADISNSSRYALFLDQIDVKLDKIKRNGFNETVFQAFYEFMTKVAVVFGADEHTAAEEMRQVAEFIVTLARITVPAEERHNQSLENNPMTISELENRYSYVPWLEYINTMLKPYHKVTPNNTVVVKIPQYYDKLQDVLRNTPKRTLANYMFWSKIQEYVTYLNDELRNLELEVYKVAFGIDKRPPRVKECTQLCIRLYVASGALFVKNFFNEKAKQEVTEIVSNVRDEFIKALKTVDWMDDATKKQALEKAEAIHLHMAYPDELLDEKKLEKYYENLTLDSSDYLGCRLNISLFSDAVDYQELDKLLDKKDWRHHSYVALVQAFYDKNENSIEFLAGILRNVFFNETKPKYMNYGAIGHIVGHEITHGFDDVGRQYNTEGNLVNWWEPKTKEAFDSKARCIIDQYGNITEPEVGLNLNGGHTQGENIADNAGIKLAYLAYKEWVKRNGPEFVLPGLPFTPLQMFWISVGNTWCSVEKNEILKLTVLQEVHAPNRYRVNVPLMNSKYFIEDFQCGDNSKMNPKHKCHVW